MPRLAAEEALEAISRTAIGSGAADEDDSRRALAAWEKDAIGHRPAGTSKQQLSPAALGAVGIGYRKQRGPKKPAPDPPPAQVE